MAAERCTSMGFREGGGEIACVRVDARLLMHALWGQSKHCESVPVKKSGS